MFHLPAEMKLALAEHPLDFEHDQKCARDLSEVVQYFGYTAVAVLPDSYIFSATGDEINLMVKSFKADPKYSDEELEDA